MISATTVCWIVLHYTSTISLHAWSDCWPRPESYNPITYVAASSAAMLSYLFGIYAGPFIVCSAVWWSFLCLADDVRRYVVVLICLPIQYVLFLVISQALCRSDIHEPRAMVPHIMHCAYKQCCLIVPDWLFLGIIVLLVAGLFFYSTFPLLRALRNECKEKDGSTMPNTPVRITHNMYEPGFQEIVTEQTTHERENNQDTMSDDEDTVSEVCEEKRSAFAYELPRIETVFSVSKLPIKQDMQAHKLQAILLEQKLARLGINGSVVCISSGPVVTLYEYQPEDDVKVSKILALDNDLALALKAHSLRIIAPIPGKNVVGFEVANQQRKIVPFGSIAQSLVFKSCSYQLPLILGRDTVGAVVITDLASSPHLLVAGSTGSGKSVCLNAMLSTLLLCKRPDECKFILIDPKRLEFMPYADIGHLLFPIITDAKLAIQSLSWLTGEMERRYTLLADHQVRNITDYNRYCKKTGDKLLPYIVVVIDELADLMMVCGKEIEHWITRLTQMARAAGIHMIVATQRPSVDVITGLIKVNIPSRIAFQVTSKIDSRTILDAIGAERLLGKGDMLAQLGNNTSLRRIHGAYIEDSAITDLVKQVAGQARPEYIDLTAIAQACDSQKTSDDLLPEVEGFIDTVDEISVSLLQRKFHIGYNRSARMVEMLEQKGRLMPQTGSKMRKVVK